MIFPLGLAACVSDWLWEIADIAPGRLVVGVPQHLADVERVNSAVDHERRRRVPQVVNAKVWHAPESCEAVVREPHNDLNGRSQPVLLAALEALPAAPKSQARVGLLIRTECVFFLRRLCILGLNLEGKPLERTLKKL